MKKVSSGDFQRNIGVYQDIALVKPLAITKHGHERLVLTSFEEYKKLHNRSRQVIKVSELSDDDVEAILDTNMSSEFDYLNKEMDD